jgi:hypothetical protein
VVAYHQKIDVLEGIKKKFASSQNSKISSLYIFEGRSEKKKLSSSTV